MIYLVASIVLALDRLTKLITCGNLIEGESIEVLPHVFHITLVLNNGAAFGVLKNKNPLFISLTFLAIAFILLYSWRYKPKDKILLLAIGLILGGAAGNVIDRIKFGCVIDFLDFRIWPVFNVADSAITLGAVILVWRMLAQSVKRKAQS